MKRARSIYKNGSKTRIGSSSMYDARSIAQLEEVPVLGCTKLLGLSPDKANKPYHPSGVGELVPHCSGKNKTLTCPLHGQQGHSIGQIRIPSYLHVEAQCVAYPKKGSLCADPYPSILWLAYNQVF